MTRLFRFAAVTVMYLVSFACFESSAQDFRAVSGKVLIRPCSPWEGFPRFSQSITALAVFAEYQGKEEYSLAEPICCFPPKMGCPTCPIDTLYFNSASSAYELTYAFEQLKEGPNTLCLVALDSLAYATGGKKGHVIRLSYARSDGTYHADQADPDKAMIINISKKSGPFKKVDIYYAAPPESPRK